MFKLESYITPLLMGYLDQYVKLRPEDLQLSLWGGDAVLYNLDLRLDVLEKILQLPITFSSGHIHELRLHVPWTKLGSEPIVVTINTVECILKVRDTAYEETFTSVASDSSGKIVAAGRIKKKLKRQTTEELPPGYLQSIVNRMVNNMSFIVNNLIIKFVEDDIVFSMNVKSAESYSCDQTWKRAFIDVTPEDLVLRKVINFSDLTVCLDKSSSDGRIDNYQEPMLYRCFVMCRLHMAYDSLHAKFPCVTRLNILSEKLECLMTDTQLPMFIRLIELFMALYFGYLDLPSKVSELPGSPTKTNTTELPSFAQYGEEEQTAGDGENVGWAAWMWSMVPQILLDEEEETMHSAASQPRPPVFAVGFYIKHFTVTFKLTEQVRVSGNLKLTFHPLLVLESTGLALEVLMQGSTFFDTQFGITHFALSTVGPCICGSRDKGSTNILVCGEDSSNEGYYTLGSLFDSSCGTRGEKHQFVLNSEEHMQKYTEGYGLQRFGAFWFDYISTLDLPDSGHSTSSSDAELEDFSLFDREQSIYRFTFGQSHIYVTSSAVHRIQKLLACAWDHHYEPYKRPKAYGEEQRLPLTENQVKELEEFLPTCSYHLTLLKPSVTVLAANHPECNVATKAYSTRGAKDKSDQVRIKGTVDWLEAKLSADRFDMQMVTPMYPGRLARLVSNIAGPSSNLMYHCHSHTQLKVFSLQAALSKTNPSTITTQPVKLLPPFSAAFYSRSLIMPHIWKNSHLPLWERSCEIPQVSLTLSKVSLMAAVQLLSSWTQQQQQKQQQMKQQWHLNPSHNFEVQHQDLFPDPGTGVSPVLELTVTSIELRVCSSPLITACTGSLSSIQLMLYLPGEENESTSILPLLYGPVNASMAANKAVFEAGIPGCVGDSVDCFAFLLQKPQHTIIAEAAPAVVVIRLEGLAGCLDPGLLDWFAYMPHNQQTPAATSNKPVAALDLSLAQATSPLQVDGSRVSVRSSSSHTVPNTSRVHSESQAMSKAPSSFPDHSSDKTSGDTQEGLSQTLSQLFPLLRMLQVQVDIKSSCIFVPKTSLRLKEPSVDIASNVWTSWKSGQVADVLGICLPAITVRSVAASCIPVLQDIPVTTLDGSLLGDKLPWTVHLSQWNVFSLHANEVCRAILEGMDLSSTVGVTVQYDPPTSDTIHSLALCVHLDITPPEFTLMHKQVALGGAISSLVWDLSSSVMQLYQHILNKLRPVQSGSLSTSCTLDDFSADQASGSSGQHHLDSSFLGNNTEALTGDQLEDISQESGPVQGLKVMSSTLSDHSLKLSAWLQLVMPRCTVSLHTVDEGSQVKMILEDFAVSCDVQQVYHKIKMSLGSISIHKYRQTSAGDWQPDVNVPVLLSTLKHLPQHVSVASNKLEVTEGQASHLYFSGQGGSVGEKRHGFLSLTYTRALCKNVLSKIKKLNVEVTNSLGISEQCIPSTLFFHKWLSEICLKVEAFDAVFHVSTLEEIRHLWLPLEDRREQTSSVQAAFNFRTSLSAAHPPKMSTKQSAILASHLCPLVHADISCVRVFLLTSVDGSTPKDHEVEEPFSKTTLAHDMLVLQLQAVHVQPYADNPLPRYALERELFHCALQAGLTQQAGFCIEDRQYQLQISAASVSSGTWAQWSCVTRDTGKYTAAAASGVQFPALEWNTYLGNRKKTEDIEVIPIVKPFNICLVVAPPIVYVREEQEEQSLLVCGLTAELNVKTDLEVYLSAKQLQIMITAGTLISQLITPQYSLSASKGAMPTPGPLAQAMTTDSGIESDLSHVSSNVFGRHARSAGSKACTLPVDILLTAGRVSLALYAHQQEIMDCTPDAATHLLPQTPFSARKSEKSDLLADNFIELTSGIGAEGEKSPAGNLCSSFDLVLQGESTQGSRAAVPAGTSCVQPFVYVYIAQPHTLVKFWPEVDKVEISCYDILIKGAEGVHVFPAMEHHILPDHADFNVYWLETRAGKPNTKTGIPPCLLTFSLINVRTLPGSLEVKVERPVKLNVTCDAVQQTIVFLEKMFPKLSEPSLPSSDNVCQERPQAVQRQLMGMMELLEAVDKIHVSTEQIVISLEAKNLLCTVGFLASVRKAFFTLETTPKTKEKGVGASGIMCLKDVLLKTVYHRQRHRFAGPASIEVEASLHWPGPDYEGATPQLSVHTKTGLLEIYVGQEHVLSLQHLYSQFEATLSALSGLWHSKQMKDEGVSEQKEDIPVPLTTARHSQDDLRSGNFVYSHHADGRVLPAAWEIMFSVEDSGAPVRGAMIWSYPEPRVIRRLIVLPIPLAPFPLAAASDNLSVPCVLQCWDECRRDYVSYAYFNLSENKKSVVDIPEMKGGELMGVSCTWRIAVLTSDGCDVELPSRHEQEEENGPDMLALVTSLAASVSVDSCAVPNLVPVVQASLSMAAVHLHLSNHIDYNGSRTPDKLKPFRLTPSVLSDEEWAVLMLTHFNIFASHIAGLQRCTSVTVSGVGQIDILDYKQLVMETFLSPVNLQSTIVLKHKQATMPIVEVRVKSEKVSLHVGRSIMHSLNVSLQAWKTFGPNNSSDTIFFGHIIVCNNTQETLRFGQVDTDENLALQSNHMTSYSWRSGSKSRQLHLCLDKATWRWCAPFCVETEGCAVRVVRAMDQHYTLIIKMRRLSPVYMQLIVSGQLVLSNQLSQPLELNLTLGDHTSRTESTILMEASSVLPALVMEHEHVCAMRVRFLGGYNVWSDLVKLRGKTVQENQLLKLVLPDGKNFIHVWCHIFCQRFSDAVQKLIVFSPLFVLRSHLPRPLLVKIETPSSRHLQQVKLHGQGQAFQLYCKGESTAHHLSFKLGPDLPHSCPPVVLSDNLVQQVKKPDMIMVDIDQLCQQHSETKEGFDWPGFTPYWGRKDCSLLEAEQPSMDLNIHLSQHKAGCSTVLVDIAPWCLLTNTAPCTLVLIASGHRLHVPSGSTIAPPKLQEFSIGFERSSLLFETRPIRLSEDEQIEHRYSSDIEDVLLLDGQVYTQLLIPPERGGTAQVLALSASSNYVQGIRMLMVSQQFTFINSTAWDLEVRLLAVPEGTCKVQQSDFEYCLNSSVFPHSNEDNRKQLLVWQMMGHASSHLIFYVMLKLAVSKQTAVNCERCTSAWSVPVRVPWTREGSHNMVAVPRHQEDLCCSVAVSMSCHKDGSGLYIMLTPDNAPLCILHNLCPFVLQFGQGLDKHLCGAPEMVLEETELLEAVPHVASWGWCHYTMPQVSARFPAIDVGPLPPLHVRVVSSQTSQDLASHHNQHAGQSKQISPWSPGISLSLANTFVQIPAVANMKVSIQVISMVKHVTFSLVSKAEISSTDVLQHAKSTQRVVRMVDSVEIMEHKVPAGAQSEEAHILPVRSAHHPAAVSRPLWPTLTVELHLEAFSFTVWDDSHADILSEALHVHLDHVLLTCYPVGGAGGSTCMALCLGDVHAYNPKAHLGHFDFPVIFMSEKSPSMLDFKVAPGLGMAEQHAVMRAASVVQLQFVLSKDIHYTEGIVFESVLMGIKPVRIYVEDTFIFYLMKECAAYMPVSLSFKHQLQSDFSGHMTVQDFGYVGQPLRIQHVCLQACNILLSVHASVKMFLATDHTPLTFAAFERQSLFTSAQQLLYSVAMHYITSAIFRAGMVVGSLDILGSPTGLVRSVRLGMSDFVRLPYQGLIQGPIAFVTGVRGGTASLLRNVTAGVVTSVTNFASSVSRNMDRLSLDDEHRERQEETRRRQPSGLSSGLWQGLSGFGLSLLGAVAGLVDQPIQTVLELEEEQKLTKRAGHLMAGVGKGLIGIITKPIGGAAELVSQTGQGLLQGAGLKQPTSVRQPASDIPRHSLPAALLKYSMKMLPDTELIVAVSATQEDLLGELVPVVLLLTSDMLTVVSCEDDAKQQAFDLLELDFFYSKPDVLTLTVADAYSNKSIEGGCGNEDLVAAFVSSTVALLPLVSSPGNDQDISDTQKCGQLSFLPTEVPYKKPCDLDADVSVVHTIPRYFQLGEAKAESADIEVSADLVNHSRVVSYDFRLPVDQAHLLLSAFCQAKLNKLGKGFLV